MPIDEILEEIDRQRNVIIKAMSVQDELVKKIRNADKSQYDWLSVKSAAELVGVTAAVIYSKINSGELECKHICSKKFVRKSQLLAIDDRYSGEQVQKC